MNREIYKHQPILVAYWTKYGATEMISKKIHETLGSLSALYKIENMPYNLPEATEMMIIGFPLYFFKMPEPVQRFLEYLAFNTQKVSHFAFFVSATMSEEVIATRWGKTWIDKFIPDEIMKRTCSYRCLGGKRKFEQLSTIDKSILSMGKKMYSWVDMEDFDSINSGEVEKFTLELLRLYKKEPQ